MLLIILVNNSIISEEHEIMDDYFQAYLFDHPKIISSETENISLFKRHFNFLYSIEINKKDFFCISISLSTYYQENYYFYVKTQ